MAIMLNKTKRELDDFDKMGLVIGRSARMYWGYQHGHLRWAPRWVRNIICTVWNWVVCHLSKHDILDQRNYEEEIRPRRPEIVCTTCCKRFTPEEYQAYRLKHANPVL